MSQSLSYYEALGVEPTASAEEIRRAFRKLAKTFHPDNFDGEARVRAEKRFQAITEAFNVLNRPNMREKYDREASRSSTSAAGMDRKEIARRLAAVGAKAYKNGKLAEAAEQLRLALDHDPELARANYFMGLTLGRLPGRERDALRHLESASRLEPNNTVMKAEAASAYLASGMSSRAERLAQEVLALDPTNSKAQTVLNLASGSGSSGSPNRKG